MNIGIMALSYKEWDIFLVFILICILIYPHEFQYYLWKQHAPRLYGDHVNVSIYFGAPFVDFNVNHCLIHEYFFSFYKELCKAMVVYCSSKEGIFILCFPHSVSRILHGYTRLMGRIA